MGLTAPVDRDRLWRDHMEMAEIGATPGGGVGRLALTDLDRQARDLFVSWCDEAGYAVRIDQMGNIFARRDGTDPNAPPVMTGSHLDTQPLGGRFDGIYGVLAGLEVLRALDEANVKTQKPLDVVVWSDEEGVRFQGGCVASGVFAGKYDLEYGLSLPDREGTTTFGTELARIGYAGSVACGGYPVSAFFEVHIEQGPVLERQETPIGIVLGAQARRNANVIVTGDEGHAGTLPMDRRRDALVGAARMIDGLNRLAFEFQPMPVITVGQVQVRPNSRNTVPGRVVFTVDYRHPQTAVLDAIDERIRDLCRATAQAAGLELMIEDVSRSDAVTFDPGCIALLREVCDRAGYAWMDIYSGAGHDACNLAFCTPTGMIFVPCKDGISHNEREAVEPDHLARGCQVLLEAMVASAG